MSSSITVSDELERALASRTTIDQAIGVLMAEQRCTADEAFDLLRSHSQNSNRKVRDLAADLIQGITGTPGRRGPLPSVNRSASGLRQPVAAPGPRCDGTSSAAAVAAIVPP